MQKLGQYFLINQSAIKKIIESLELKSGETVIEIGPGRGELTFPLLKECQKTGCKIIAIEKDPLLAKRFGENIQLPISNFQIINDDVLKFLPKLISNCELEIRNWKLVGNIPYYITGKLLRILSELESKPELTILMIQKEVAERLTAQPPQMNLLAAAVQFWAKPEILFTLKPNDFSPPPEVESAAIKLTTHNKQSIINSSRKYYELLHIIFKQPRKTIFNNLKTGLEMPPESIENRLKSLGIDPKSRPQNLSIEQIKELVKISIFT